MNVVIIEDEKRTAQRLESLLLAYDPTVRVLAKLPSIAKSLAWFAKPTPAQPDQLFLDIHLDDGSGFQFLEQAGLTLPVVFTTAYDQYKLVTLLDPRQFFRVNRAFLFSLDAIQLLHAYSGSKLKVNLQPPARQDVLVSGERVSDFKEWLGK